MFTLLSTITGVSPGATSTQPLWPSGYRFSAVTFFAFNGFDVNAEPTPNSSGMLFGFHSTELPYRLATGASLTYTCSSNKANNLSNFWIRARSGDGVYLIAE